MLEVKVRSIVNEAVGINCFELVDPHGRELPPFKAGAHIDAMIPGNFVRQYSLCNDPRERFRYVIGVLKQDDGRGGWKAMHTMMRAGDLLKISRPRNNFSLTESASQYLLIAGGIGETPMMAMVEKLKSTDAKFTMHYCARSPDRMAFKVCFEVRRAPRTRTRRLVSVRLLPSTVARSSVEADQTAPSV